MCLVFWIGFLPITQEHMFADRNWPAPCMWAITFSLSTMPKLQSLFYFHLFIRGKLAKILEVLTFSTSCISVCVFLCVCVCAGTRASVCTNVWSDHGGREGGNEYCSVRDVSQFAFTRWIPSHSLQWYNYFRQHCHWLLLPCMSSPWYSVADCCWLKFWSCTW